MASADLVLPPPSDGIPGRWQAVPDTEILAHEVDGYVTFSIRLHEAILSLNPKSKPDLWTPSSSENDESIGGKSGRNYRYPSTTDRLHLYRRHFTAGARDTKYSDPFGTPFASQVSKRFLDRTNLEFSNFLHSGRHLIEQLIFGMTPTGHLLKLHFADDAGGWGGAVLLHPGID
ncbi:hypothetical protein NPIL_660081 [Nephila pilipes]|uniref:Uncharacterized protein n=1 Tax=Nephila pilipes TaxID=299642 RepID=A0A8X6IJ82_NEPPI|nr:hypothetical protein NPIL_660081 [Nephila pilipes]